MGARVVTLNGAPISDSWTQVPLPHFPSQIHSEGYGPNSFKGEGIYEKNHLLAWTARGFHNCIQ